MGHHHDVFPARDSEFDSWFRTLEEYVVAKTQGAHPEWTHIPATEVAMLSLRYEEWHAAYAAAVAEPSPQKIAAKNTQRAEAEAFLRPFINKYLRYDPVTPADRAAMGIPEHKSTHSPVPEPEAPPKWAMENDGLWKIRFDIEPPDAERPHIPDGYDGALMSYAITDAPVEEIKQLPLRKRLTQGISRMQFSQDEEGKYLSASLRWETDSNLDGPQSAVQSIKIR